MIDWTAIGSFATALTVGAAAVQIYYATRQEKTEFEDGLTKEYREIVGQLPKSILLQDPGWNAAADEHFPLLYRYLDLCNEQVFLRKKGRIRKSTWGDWCAGIRSNLEKPAFREAWELVRSRTRSFDELRWLEATEFRIDPRYMPDVDARRSASIGKEAANDE
jgi:hypothetical protein